jgi:signal transduction histidine kinase
MELKLDISGEPPDFQQVFEGAPGLSLLLIPDCPRFTVLTCTNSLIQCTGRPETELSPRSVLELFEDPATGCAGIAAADLLASLTQVLLTKRTQIAHWPGNQKYENVTFLGLPYWEFKNIPICLKDGRVAYIICTIDDQSDICNQTQPNLKPLSRGGFQVETADNGRLFAEANNSLSEDERSSSELNEKLKNYALGSDVGFALTKFASLQPALESCAQAIARHLEVAWAEIWTFKSATGLAELRASAGKSTLAWTSGDWRTVRQSMVDLIAKEGRPYLTNDVSEHGERMDLKALQAHGIVAFAGYPLIVEKRIVGVVTMYAYNHFETYTLAMFGSIADSIAIGIGRKAAEEALIRQSEDLTRSNAELERFVHVTSHDLREPLRTMLTFADLLVRHYRGLLDSTADDYLEHISSGAERMIGLVDSLVAYSRAGSAEGAPFNAIELNEALTWATVNLHSAICETNAIISQESLPVVRGNKVQLGQVFQNLLSNAIKYKKPAEAPRIHVSVVGRENEWAIQIEDSGIGLEPRYREEIFGIFKRLHGDEIPGAGIGLAVTQKIIEQHGGRIWVESELGKGSIFVFTLPK